MDYEQNEVDMTFSADDARDLAAKAVLERETAIHETCIKLMFDRIREAAAKGELRASVRAPVEHVDAVKKALIDAGFTILPRCTSFDADRTQAGFVSLTVSWARP